MVTKECPKCHTQIQAANYNRHVTSCDGSGPKRFVKQIPPENMSCQFCQKECKNLNSLRQHECRCSKNPDRKDFDKVTKYIRDNIKGHTADDNSVIAKQQETMKAKYASGYVHPCLGRKRNFEYIYLEHNLSEMTKWEDYVASLVITIPEHEIRKQSWGYNVLANPRSISVPDSTTIYLTFEHDMIANILLNGNLKKENTVHHIDIHRENNSIDNLMVFVNSDAHKRFHNSKYAYLVYDDETHLFDCLLKKD